MATALLVVDMQRIFADMTVSALPNITKLISHFQSNDMPCIFTQHGHSKEELTPPFKNQVVRKWGPSGSIATGSEQWELQDEILSQSKGCPVVGKNTYHAFINTDLEKILQEKKVERIVVCGVMTDCCCDTSARSAFNRGYETWLVEDACGTATEKQHQAGLQGFRFACGNVIKTAEVIRRLSQS